MDRRRPRDPGPSTRPSFRLFGSEGGCRTLHGYRRIQPLWNRPGRDSVSRLFLLPFRTEPVNYARRPFRDLTKVLLVRDKNPGVLLSFFLPRVHFLLSSRWFSSSYEKTEREWSRAGFDNLVRTEGPIRSIKLDPLLTVFISTKTEL